MKRSAIASRLVCGASCGTHARVVGQSIVNGAAGRVAASVKVVLPGTAKSAWKRKTLYAGVAAPGNSTNGLGAPAGGRLEPSKSPGRNASSVGPPVMPGV